MNVFKIAFPEKSGEQREIISGYSDKLTMGPSHGFIFSPFGLDSEVFSIAPSGYIPTEEMINLWCLENSKLSRSADHGSTSEREHLNLVEDAVEFCKMCEKKTGEPSKVICTRIKICQLNISISEMFRRLCESHPTATVFLFSTPFNNIGTWIGATPELLLEADTSNVKSVALAGTRLAGSFGEWDSKNIEEQRIVRGFVCNLLESSGLNVKYSETYTKTAGRVEHLCTDIEAQYPENEFTSDEQLIDLALKLSPTPALGGYPRHDADTFIRTHEREPRQCYGGFIGLSEPGRLRTYVNLRSGRLQSSCDQIALFAGGGITKDSVPADEWQETERKLTTLAENLS